MCFNYKLSKCIFVFIQCERGVIDCNEWKTEKRHECANMGKEKRLKLLLLLLLLLFVFHRACCIDTHSFKWLEVTETCWRPKNVFKVFFNQETKLRGLSPHANYTDRAAAAGRRS